MAPAAEDSVQLKFEVSGLIIKTVALNHSSTAVPEKLAGRVSLAHIQTETSTFSGTSKNEDEWEELVQDAEKLAQDHPANHNPITSLPQTVLGLPVALGTVVGLWENWPTEYERWADMVEDVLARKWRGDLTKKGLAISLKEEGGVYMIQIDIVQKLGMSSTRK